MANPWHEEMLRKGSEAWHRWREKHPNVAPDLQDCDLSNRDLSGFNLGGADLKGAVLIGADLSKVMLTGANLLVAYLEDTILTGVDLRTVSGLDSVRHIGPTVVDRVTLAKSEGRIPAAFLRGCGFADWEIEAAKLNNPDLTSEQVIDITYKISGLRTESPIQVNPLFISYSHVNRPFVETLEKRFDEKRIRYWRDVHDMKAGRMETQIERAIRHNPIVLLVLSEASVESDWVEWEVSKARELEKAEKRDVLCPVALDDSWKTCSWPGPLRQQIEDYNILDFSGWKDGAAMQRQFQRLIDGLGLFYPTAG